ncbi:MAG: GNAT family N-acetyltransferase [bacterium]
MKEVIEGITVEMSKTEDVETILSLIMEAPDALLAVSQPEILGWIATGQSMVAKNLEGEIVGHQGMEYWEKANLVEIRSAYVMPEYRGRGLNTAMKKQMIKRAKEKYPEAMIVGFTESASKSRGVLQRLGFEEIPFEEVPEDLFSVCPDTCVKKTGIDCGCKVYVLKKEE